MVAPRAYHVGWIVGVLLSQKLGWSSGASTCTTITVSGVGGVNGIYEKGPSTFDPYLRPAGPTFYEIYPFTSSDVSGWYIAVGDTVVYRIYDPALHPADVTLDWVECDGSRYCNDGAAVSQPVIACEEDSTSTPATCLSVTVSATRDLDGTYEEGPTTGDPFYRPGGTTFYEIYKFTSSDVPGWYIAVGNTVVYRVYDSALHPADVTLDWVECDGSRYCNAGAALSQPVIACEEDPTSNVELTRSTCTSVTVSDARDRDGTYEESSDEDDLFYQGGGTTFFEMYPFTGSDHAGWYITDRNTAVYRIYDSALHPADITLEWVECDGSSYCNAVAASLQPVIACAENSTTETAPSTCSSFTVSGLGDEDGTYKETSTDDDFYFYYKAGGTTFFEIHLFTNSDNAGWYITSGNNVVYRTYDSAVHPADISLEWVECDGSNDCDTGAALSQPVVTCEEDSTPEPAPSTCSSFTVSGLGDVDGVYEGKFNDDDFYFYYMAAGNTFFEIYPFTNSDNAGWYIEEVDTVLYRTYDSAVHPADISLDWVECDGSNYCDAGAALSQPVITCEEDVVDAGSTSNSTSIPAPTPSTCTSVTVFGLGDVDGTFEESSPVNDIYRTFYGESYLYSTGENIFFRAGGKALYTISQYVDSNTAGWYILDDNFEIYRTIDSALHPADITLDWVECDGSNGCSNVAAPSQPVIACAEDSASNSTSTLELAPSVCSNVTISGVGDLDGTYEEGCSFVYYPTTSFFSRAQDATGYAIYRSFDDWGNGFWYMVVDLNEVYRTIDTAQHPADITLEWVQCDGRDACSSVPAPLQPVITCAVNSTTSQGLECSSAGRSSTALSPYAAATAAAAAAAGAWTMCLTFGDA